MNNMLTNRIDLQSKSKQINILINFYLHTTTTRRTIDVQCFIQTAVFHRRTYVYQRKIIHIGNDVTKTIELRHNEFPR